MHVFMVCLSVPVVFVVHTGLLHTAVCDFVMYTNSYVQFVWRHLVCNITNTRIVHNKTF